MLAIELLLLCLGAYLWGSLSPSYVIARWRWGIDLRRYGSGNVGSSNVGEQLGLAWKIAAGLADVFKGCVPATLARWLGFDLAATVMIGLATLIGHNWSLFLGFSGGRGIAVTLGVLCVWELRLVVFLLMCFMLPHVLGWGGLISMAALALLAPAAWLLQTPPSVITGCVLIALLVALKRLEANRLPLPGNVKEKRAVLWRRLWLDRDVPPEQPWEKRGKF
jgi:glycerol-3-phosphate acyltransferase PlsY